MGWLLDKAAGVERPLVRASESFSRPPLSAPPPSAVPQAASAAHLWRGMSRPDVKELGDFIDAGEAVLLVVGESTIEEAIDKAGLKAEIRVAKKIKANTKEVEKEIKEAAKTVH
jgi:hypothetical protein